MERSNRHPADQLADLRERIQQLESKRPTSVPTYFTIPTNFVGSDYKAIVGYQTRKRVDIEGLTREFGPRLSVLYASHSIASASTSTPASA